MYMSPDAVDDVLSPVAGALAGSSVVFDYVYAESIEHPDPFEGAPMLDVDLTLDGRPMIGLWALVDAVPVEHAVGNGAAGVADLNLASASVDQIRLRAQVAGVLRR